MKIGTALKCMVNIGKKNLANFFKAPHRHAPVKGWNCPVLASQNCSKMPKKTEMADFGATRSGFHKIAKSSLFYC